MLARDCTNPDPLRQKASSLLQAAELADIDADEILWAIEAAGICETDLHVIAAVDEPATL